MHKIKEMRKNIYSLSIALLLGCSACNDWLTVQPATSILAEDLYTTNDGIKQALNGTYLNMRGVLYNPAGYMGGGGMAESLACSWTVSEGNREYDLSNHDYDSDLVESSLSSSFQGFYKIIVTMNDLIQGVELNKGKISDDVYNIGVGEAHALRALAHFDLIRLWGPVPSKVDVNRTYLPYVTVNSANRYEYVTYEKYMTLLFEDLKRAEELLGKSDVVLKMSFEDTETTSSVWPYRKSRMNYYGVLGLLARVHLWCGNIEEALRYARLVKDATNPDGSKKFRLTNEVDDFPDNSWVDGTCYSEHICGTKCDTYDYGKGGWQSGRAMIVNVNPTFVQTLFDGNTSDFRYKKLWTYERTGLMIYGYVLRKYRCFYTGTKAAQNFPIIRLSEMYLMIMEKAPLTEANEVYKEFCTARGLEYVPLTEIDRQGRVYKEWIRELIGEGQNFFTYKRLNVRNMIFGISECSEEQYILPIPEKEYISE